MATRTLSSKLSEAEKGLTNLIPSEDVGSPSKGSHAGWKHAQAAQALASALLYAGVAISMNFVNKATMQVFPVALVVLFWQMVATVVTLGALRQCGFIVLAPVSLAKVKSITLITVLYTANTAFALIGLRSLNVPMYSTLKRLTPVIVLVVKSWLKRQLPAWDIAASIVLVMVGCLVAGLGDLTFDWVGYGCALLSCSLQASYLILVEHNGSEYGMGSAELLYYSALLSAPVLLLLAVATGEARHALVLAHAAARSWGGTSALTLLLAASSLCGCLLNYSLFLCTVCNNALTTTIVGVLKGVVATVLGFFLLGGVQFHWLNVSGVVLNTAGGVWYTWIHYRTKYAGIAPSPAGAPASKESAPFRPLAPNWSSYNLPMAAARVQAPQQRG